MLSFILVCASAGRLPTTRLTARANVHASMPPPQSNSLHFVASIPLTAVTSFAVYQNLSAVRKSHISAVGHAAFVRDLSFHYILSVQHRGVLSMIQIHTSLSLKLTHTHIHKRNRITVFSSEPVGDSGERGVDGWRDK